MKTIARFTLDIIGICITSTGFVGVVYGLVILRRKHFLEAAAIMVGGVMVILFGAFLAYVSQPKDKRRFTFESKVLDNIIMTLLPPW